MSITPWIYSETVKDHFLHPRNFLVGDESAYAFDARGLAGNPICGDEMLVFIKVGESDCNFDNSIKSISSDQSSMSERVGENSEVCHPGGYEEGLLAPIIQGDERKESPTFFSEATQKYIPNTSGHTAATAPCKDRRARVRAPGGKASEFSTTQLSELSKLKIIDIKWKTYGCASAIASTSALSEIAKGKTLEEALKITPEQIAEYLGGLPKHKFHCSVLGQEALAKAIQNYKEQSCKPPTKP